MTIRFQLAAWGLLLPLFARGQEPAAGPPGNLQSVLDRIHRHAAGEAWREDNWRDDQIERWLDQAVGLIAKAVENPELKLPVRLAAVRPAEIVPGGTLTGALIVGQNLDLKTTTLTNSIVLADGNVELKSARGCVIVARGVVTAESSEVNVIVAGALVRIAMWDGSARDTANNGSVILTRGWADLQSAHGSMILAHEGTTLESARDALFINATMVGSIDRAGNRTLRVRGIPLEELPALTFAEPLRVIGLVRSDADPVDTRRLSLLAAKPPPPLGIVLRYGDRRYFAALGQPIHDQDGQPVEAFRGWQVSYADDQVAIFSNAVSDVPVRLEGR
jgi:hypothetical protein